MRMAQQFIMKSEEIRLTISTLKDALIAMILPSPREDMWEKGSLNTELRVAAGALVEIYRGRFGTVTQRACAAARTS